MRLIPTLFLSVCSVLMIYANTLTPPVVHSHIGQHIAATDSAVSLRLYAQRHGYGRGESYDADIASPKSVTFAKDGSKFYVNSLEGCKTVVYDSRTLKKLKVITYNFASGEGSLWSAPSGFYTFTHYKNGASRSFSGKPVESCLTPDGKYLFVPFYRRSFDINAQDPSALAVIDTRTDSILLIMETGPLPKMVKVSNDGRTLAITHWGNNTVGLVDISHSSPRQWKHKKPIIVDHIHPLNYPLNKAVNRDSGSGYSLRGTLFLPGDSLMLVSAMGGAVAVIDPIKGEWLGWLPQLFAVRHIILSSDRQLFFSRNSAGEVVSLPLDSLLTAISRQRGKTRNFAINGMRRVKVGGGTRTIELSPSGRFLFAACNTASALYVVDTHTMKVIAKTPVDSYPVGLDVSPDGSLVVLTSQGRKGFGGNAVNIFAVEYSMPEIVPNKEETDTAAAVVPSISAKPSATSICKQFDSAIILGVMVAAAACMAAIWLYRRRRNKIHKQTEP